MISKHRRLRAAIDQLQAGIAAAAQDNEELAGAARALQVQIAALSQVVAEVNHIAKPDANGWIARPTL